jgi:hypothetical protein
VPPRLIKNSKLTNRRLNQLIGYLALEVSATRAAKVMSSHRHSAERVYQVIRRCLARECELHSPLGGEVECDESYFGGRRKRPFNLIVAFERAQDAHGHALGRAVAESSFHHFVDYNWDTSTGCPSFVAEPPGDQLRREPEKLEDVKTYVRNLALWLAG